MKRTIVIIAILAIVALLVFAGVRQIQKSKAELPKSISELQDERGVPVEIARAYKGTFSLSRTYLGTVEGVLQGDAVASIMEEIVEIPVRVGDRVKKGDVVCRLNTRAFQAQYNQLKLAYEDAQREAKRMEKLYETGAISKQMLEKAQLSRDIAEQNLEASAKVVALTAPLDGVVTDVFYRVGETTKIGEPVVRIANLNKVKARFSANYNDWKQINRQSPVVLRVNGDGSKEIPARISDISMSADPDSRLFSIWVEADNEDRTLHPGLMIDVSVVVLQKPDVTLIPRDAVLTRDEKLGVFVIGDDQRASFTLIKTGDANMSEIEIITGLNPGDTIVVYGQNNLNNGQLVKITAS